MWIFFALQSWPKADFVLSSLICFHFPGKLNASSASLCLVITEVMASCSLPMVLCAVCPALRARVSQRQAPSGISSSLVSLAGRCGVSLRVWSTSQLDPASFRQTLQGHNFFLLFVIIPWSDWTSAATSRHTFLVSTSSQLLAFTLMPV